MAMIEVLKSQLMCHDKTGYRFLYHKRQLQINSFDACRLLPYSSTCMGPARSETNVQALVRGHVKLLVK